MKPIVKMRFGSHVYGTATPESDTDYKVVFIPSARDIVLGKGSDSWIETTKKDLNQKNNSTDIETEYMSLKKFMSLLLEGQTCALDMIFAPEEHYQPLEDGDHSHYWWRTIVEIKKNFIHKGITAFAGYARQQANKYGIKGSRVAAVRDWLDFLKAKGGELGDSNKLWVIWPDVEQYVKQRKEQNLPGAHHIAIVEINGPDGKPVNHVDVCNRKMSRNNTIKQTIDVYQRVFDEYGQRTLKAESNQGIDWKALSHAVRVANEANELLSTGKITFPRPERELLIKIKKGEIPYKDVADMIEKGLSQLEEWQETSDLPSEPDHGLAEQIVYEAYLAEVKQS